MAWLLSFLATYGVIGAFILGYHAKKHLKKQKDFL